MMVAMGVVNENAKRISIGEKMRVGGGMVEVIGIREDGKYMRWMKSSSLFLSAVISRTMRRGDAAYRVRAQTVFEAVRKLARDVPASDCAALSRYFDNGAMFGVKVSEDRGSGWGGGLCGAGGFIGGIERSGAPPERDRNSVALGARQGQVFAMIVRQGIGDRGGRQFVLGRCLSGSRLLRGLVPGSGESFCEPGAAGLVIVASLVACAVPAIRVEGRSGESVAGELNYFKVRQAGTAGVARGRIWEAPDPKPF